MKSLSAVAARSVVGLIVAAFSLLAGNPASAGTVIADTGSGTAPSAYVPVTVDAQTFQGAGANAIVLSTNLILDASNDYNSQTDTGVELDFAGASLNLTASFFSSLTLAVAQRNADGSIGTFQTITVADLTDITPLPNKLLIEGIQTSWSFLEISGLTLTSAAGLGTPGAQIDVSGEVYNLRNVSQIFETIAPTVLVDSVQDVPAPGALALLVLGLAGLAAFRRRAPQPGLALAN